MENKIAKFISLIFHPLLLPTYALTLIFSTDYYFVPVLPDDYKFLLIGFVFITSFILPVIMMLLLLKAKMINSLQMETQNERVLPLLIVAGFFFGIFYFLRESPQIANFNIFLLGSTVLVLISLVLNYFTKISIHMIAHGGLSGTFIGLALTYNQDIRLIIYCILLIAGLTAFARLKLKAHSQFQVYSGFLIGCVFMLCLFLFV
ncbi:MAG: hypothetical protein GXO88_13365 [Chlorobi bacterium]|nr:hypothetical protein [Chlorobiota bacterium]